LHWIVVEDAEMTSKSVYAIIKRSRVQHTHIAVPTPTVNKLKPTDPNWLLPRGVPQRNAALEYIRNNLGASRTGVVYFGDDDNVYDWRLFDEMRKVKRVGVWPVGVVGGLMAEHAVINTEGTVVFVWHTRTEKTKLSRAENSTLIDRMGERKGQNHYYPPDFDPKKHKTLNGYHGVHALRERAHKIGQGILIIRFEMPFNIWCLGCNNHVGMGVRYNAEKKKVGMFYTTPVYEFRMKCHLCDNYYVIRTDPGKFDYELVEGCTRQEKRFDPSEVDGSAPIDRGEHLKLAADAMYKAENAEDDRTKGTKDDKKIDHLEWLQERMRDDFAANSALRRSFRNEKKSLNEQRALDDDLRKRSSLSIKLIPEHPEDKKVAGMLTRYKNVKSYEERQKEERESIANRRIFKKGEKGEEEEPSSSKGRLVKSLQEQKNRKFNDEFDRKRRVGEASGLTRSALGIVKKKQIKVEDHDDESIDLKEEEEGEEVKEEVTSSSSFHDIEYKQEIKAEINNSLSALAQYSSSSDSD
ncbi:hypothetical protein PFISCL1PPCAC_5465, partial [Pristionchus fissidentatus]